METKKVLGIIFSLLFLGAFAFVLSWGVINFNKVKDGMSGTQIYDSEDINKAYQDGYDTALKDKEEYTELINGYRDTITTLNDNISQLNSQITILTNSNKDYANQLIQLNEQKTNLQSQVDNLNTIKANNETTIADLNNQISSLQSQITNLKNSGEDKSEQIANLNAQVTNLQKTVNQLQKTNQMNLETITSLNTQIASLNSQISEITENSQNYTGRINALNNKIAELQKSITYYETYISQLESSEQVVATFEFDGSVYNIQIVNKGSKLAVATPTSTTYKIFNGWTVNGQTIDLNTYTISANTKIIADITYKYDVKFKVDDEIISSQIITKNDCATLPTNPTKSGYEFDGWSINGVDVISNISSKQVTENTTYIAVFTKLHTVTFVYENETKSTQIVRNGNLASSIDVVNTQYKVFNGWTVDNTIIDLSNYKVFNDTTFVANITYKYDVIFKVDDTNYNSQLVVKNGCATLPSNPTKDGYEFDGWSINGVDMVTNIANIQVTDNTIYKAVFTKIYIVKFISNGQTISTQNIRTGGRLTLPANQNREYYNFIGWSINGVDVVTDIASKQITANVTYIAVFDKLVDFVAKNFNGLTDFFGDHVWTDGDNIYYSYNEQNYVLDKSTSTWKVKSWNGVTKLEASNIWSDGTNIYFSSLANQYVLDKSTSTWIKKKWTGISSFIFVGRKIWTDGTNYYFSHGSNQYVLDKSTSTWNAKSWNGLNDFIGDLIWTDGDNIYYSCDEQNYVLDKSTSTWNVKNLNGLAEFSSIGLWTDGDNIYYSYSDKQYVLDKSTSTWKEKTWNGLTSFYGSDLWTDGENYYYSHGSTHYMFVK